jgi:hypothetical protein
MALAGCPPDRLMSAAVFGNRYRLELMVALAEGGDEGVNLSQLAQVTTLAEVPRLCSPKFPTRERCRL